MTQVRLPVMFDSFADKTITPQNSFNLKTDAHWHLNFILYPKEVGLDPKCSSACAVVP